MTGAGAASSAIEPLRQTQTIRARANALLDRARRGQSPWFAVNDAALAGAARVVAEVTRSRYPDLKIPYHSRWRHFEAGGANRIQGITDPRAQIDLALVSVLLDAGAGPDWSYREANGQTHVRSEGLGVASLHAFKAGLFSSDAGLPLRADAAGLQRVTAQTLGAAFQVSASNPLVGLEGRAELMRRLGAVLAAQPEVFGSPARPGGLFDHLTRGGRKTIEAHDILRALLDHLSAIWPAQNVLDGVPLGDCWPHPAVEWMPFHKLSQWLTYSLLEPFEWAGVKVAGLDALTGLPEYRNGGLLLDSGVLRAKNDELLTRAWQAGDECIVEWRALTVALLDELAPLVRAELNLSAQQMPLACVLEGGTWAAGRVLAQRLRDGSPPLNIISDGTVF